MTALIIAEAGVNHNGDVDIAMQMIDAAVQANADVVKFQTAGPTEVATRHAAKAAYQSERTGGEETQLEMIERLHFGDRSQVAFRKLAEHARRQGIEFMSSPFDVPSLRLLVDELGLRRLKLASGEITNAQLLLAAASTGCEIILSTGMATIAEINEALGVLAFGYIGGNEQPRRAGFAQAYRSGEGRAALRDKVVLLHCVTAYPTPLADVNLRAMDTMRAAFSLPVGYSDHTLGLTASLTAAALGAAIIEKHFTLSRQMRGPDHAASLEPVDLARLVREIREVEKVLGDPAKVPAASELVNVQAARRSLVARRAIARGETLTPDNIAAKRPQQGISAIDFFDVLGTTAARDYVADEAL